MAPNIEIVGTKYPFVHANEDNPIVFNTWEKYTVEYTPTKHAYSINIGLYLKGKGKAWIDNISVEVMDEIESVVAPSPVSVEKAKDYLTFAKGYGYTKFFHPSDEVENLNVETYLYHSVKEVMNSKDNKSLVKAKS